MLSKISHFIANHCLLDTTKKYLVAVSGGADSVCLLLVLKAMGYKVEAVHCNFNLRGEESKRDENFVVNLCCENAIELHLIHFDTISYASLHHVSVEMAARQLRYAYFEQLRQDIEAADICVAHHQDDSVETMLMNLLRGTGVRGLTGIQPRNGHVVRPLLCVNRAEIMAWLNEYGQEYVTDSSNADSYYQRNFLRNEIVPILKQRMPNCNGTLIATARRMNEVAKVYEAAMEAAQKRLIIDDSIVVSQLLQEPSAESILYEWLSTKGFTSYAIEQIAAHVVQGKLQSGQIWSSATHEMTVHGGRLVVQPIVSSRPTLRIPEAGTYHYDTVSMLKFEFVDGNEVSRKAEIATLDAAKVKFPLTVRPVKAGDRFCPLGMKGSKLVSDYLTDKHFSVFEKRSKLVVEDADGRILWLVNERPDDRFRITKHTQKVLRIAHFGK